MPHDAYICQVLDINICPVYLLGYDKVSKGSYLWHRSMFMNLKEYGKVQIMNQKGFINLRALAEFEKM